MRRTIARGGERNIFYSLFSHLTKIYVTFNIWLIKDYIEMSPIYYIFYRNICHFLHGVAHRLVSGALPPGYLPNYIQGPVRDIPRSCPRYSRVLSIFEFILLFNQTFADQLNIVDVQWSDILVYYIIKYLDDN